MLTGKIAAFLNDQAVVINLGSEHGVKPGMRFVATYKTSTITDPDDKEVSLGDLSFEIAMMQATNVQKKMTVCTILNPYYETLSLGLNLWTQMNPTTKESKIDQREAKIADSDVLKLRIGTIVVEAPPDSDQEQSAKKPAK
jgi:hypothetical protein